jgi:cell division protease FtsH
VFGADKVTSGASSDIQQATKLARAMVTQWGFSSELGTVMYGDNQEEVFLGYSMGKQQTISEETARKIDSEVRRLVETGYAEARRILTDKREQLEALAKALLEYETLSGDEIVGLLAGKPPVRESADDPPTPRGSAVPTAGKAGKPRPKPEGGLEPQPQV